MGFDIMFNIMPIIVMIMFGLVFTLFVLAFINGFKEKKKNDGSPILDVNAEIATKHGDVSHHHSGTNDMGRSTTTYYVTFQFESGDRLELMVQGSEYGMMREGDKGKLRFQGTRFISFTR